MIPVAQRQFYVPGESVGDCLKCCVASLLELDYDDVPHFAEHDNWNQMLDGFLALHGWRRGQARYWLDDDDPRRLVGYTHGYWIAGVDSMRSTPDGEPILHAIVMHDDEVAWDPHPDRDQGHRGFNGEAWLLVPLDPAHFIYCPELAA